MEAILRFPASISSSPDSCPAFFACRKPRKQKPPLFQRGYVNSLKGGLFRPPFIPFGADNGIRTRDPRLGKPMLYQLSYVRICGAYYIGAVHLWQGRACDFRFFF